MKFKITQVAPERYALYLVKVKRRLFRPTIRTEYQISAATGVILELPQGMKPTDGDYYRSKSAAFTASENYKERNTEFPITIHEYTL